MKAICDICGKYSESEKICTSCGSEIISEDEIPQLEFPSQWGWAVFKFGADEIEKKIAVIECLRKEWFFLEEFTFLKLVKSQIDQFDDRCLEIKVLVREDFLVPLQKMVFSRLENSSVEFSPVSFVHADEANELLRIGRRK